MMVSRKLEERDGDVCRLTKQLEDVTRMVKKHLSILLHVLYLSVKFLLSCVSFNVA